MSRWHKRNQQTVVPIDNLLREKENKNSVAVGTVMKFGMMQFTSIRSSCYNMGALSSTSPVQNSASSPTSPSDLNDTKISTETTPKPRKFFKSRNAAPSAEIQQIAFQQQQQLAMQQQMMHSNNHVQHSPDEQYNRGSPQKQTRKKQASPKKEKVEKPKVEKTPKVKKERPLKQPKVKEVVPDELAESDDEEIVSPRRGRAQAEGTRSSGRARGRMVNYNEEAGEEEFLIRTEKRIAPRFLKGGQQQQSQQQQPTTPSHTITTSSIESQNLLSQNSVESSGSSNQAINHPPIVLRISKGTSRLVSTDNEDGVKSPAHGTGSSDENKNVTNTTALTSTDELIAVLSGDAAENANAVQEEKPPEQKAERIRIRIKKDYIRSYNDSLKEQEEAQAKKDMEEQQQAQEKQVEQKVEKPEPPPTGRTTRRRGKQQQQQQPEAPRISPIVSEFDSQSSVLGSSSSQNTTASSIVVPSDSKVIRSRGSSVVTSDIDTSQQSSLAAAPPSDIHMLTTGSENTSMEVDEDVPLVAPKGRRGRKKNVPEVKKIELKPPEPVTPQKVPVAASRGGRNTRGSKVQAVVESSDLNTSSETVESTPEKAGGRSTRSTRNNINNNNVTIDMDATAPVPRFFTRKRKNAPPPEEPELETSMSTDDQMSALNLSQKSNLSSAPSSVPEYKHKKLVKRSWEQDNGQKQPSVEADLPLPPPATTTTTTTKSPNKQSNNHVQKQNESATENSGMKLLISKKKGSIFKSRALEKDESDNKKRNLNLYKHKWEDDDELMDGSDGNNKPENLAASSSGNTDDASFFEGEPSGLTRFTRTKKTESVVKDSSMADDFEEEEEDDQPITGLKCDRNAKNFYQVVRNVKKAHQIQEIGEFQEMDDDVEYLLDALQPNSQVALRCLSALQLASKCMTPSFRMHIRAHGIVPKFFKALEDAPNDPSLGLCTAMVMFALSQDTLKMDLDRGSLELMLNLLECESSQKQYPKDVVMNKQHMERKQKVRELCEEIQGQGKSIHLNLDNITAAQLAMESLLSLTSKRAGEWLKEDLRELGGIEHIIKTVCDCCHQITEHVEEWTEPLLEKLNKICRCLRILENVTSNNEENQKYILHYKSQVFVKTLCKFFNLLSKELAHHPTTEKSAKESTEVAIRETLVPLLKVIINLTHPFNERAIGSVLFGDFKEIFQISISLLLFGVNYVSPRLQFDFSLLTLVLLSNLTQLNEKNQQSIMQLQVPVEESSREKQPALKSLIEYFYKCEDKAKTLKKLTDDLIDSSKQRDAKQDEAVNALIQNSGTHMENTILGSFTSTLVGFVIMHNPNNEAIARKYLRTGKFRDMVAVLMQYYEFLNLTVSADASSMAQLKTIKNVMDFLRNADIK